MGELPFCLCCLMNKVKTRWIHAACWPKRGGNEEPCSGGTLLFWAIWSFPPRSLSVVGCSRSRIAYSLVYAPLAAVVGQMPFLVEWFRHSLAPLWRFG